MVNCSRYKIIPAFLVFLDLANHIQCDLSEGGIGDGELGQKSDVNGLTCLISCMEKSNRNANCH